MTRGILMEPLALTLVGERCGAKVTAHDQEDFCTNPDYPWAHALPDGWCDGIPVEVKVPRPGTFARVASEGLPDQWALQLAHVMAVTRAPAILFGALNPITCEVLSLRIQRDDNLCAALMQGEEEFWKSHVLTGNPPDEAVPTDATAPAHDGPIDNIEDQDLTAAVRGVLRLRDICEEADAAYAAAKERVRQLAGGRDAFRVPVNYIDRDGKRYPWAVVYDREQAGRRTFDHAAAVARFPELRGDEFWRSGKPFRTMRVYPSSRDGLSY